MYGYRRTFGTKGSFCKSLLTRTIFEAIIVVANYLGLSVAVVIIAFEYDIYQGRSFDGFPFLFCCYLQLLLDGCKIIINCIIKV